MAKPNKERGRGRRRGYRGREFRRGRQEDHREDHREGRQEDHREGHQEESHREGRREEGHQEGRQGEDHQEGRREDRKDHRWKGDHRKVEANQKGMRAEQNMAQPG